MSGNRTRKVDFQEPALTFGAAAGKSGLEFLQSIVAGKIPAPPLHATLGLQLVQVGDGVARCELVPGDHLYGPSNAVQGGLAATLLEVAMSAAATSVLDVATACTTANLNVNVTRAITGRIAKVLVEGWVVHRGSRLITLEGRLSDADGRLLAHGSATCLVVERAGA
jgi:uncharacterized protein (TIGR00369 family)